MDKLIFVVTVLNFTVEFIMLMAVDRLSGLQSPWWGKLAVSLAAGLHAGLCLTDSARFLAQPCWRWGILVALGLLLYGKRPSMLPRLSLMLLLNFAVEGFQQVTDPSGLFPFAAAGVLIAMICVLCFRGSANQRYLNVQLPAGDRRVEFTALADTGNILRDPITGESVLIVSHKIASQLTGLTRQQLASPLETMEQARLPGLRLIPYHCVGCDNGMLLGMRFSGGKIGGKEKDLLVAFAPGGLGKEGTFQALAGGVL